MSLTVCTGVVATPFGKLSGRLTLANHASSKKRIRQTAKRTLRNKHIRSTVRTTVKRVRAAVTSGDAGAAGKALEAAVSYIDKAVTKGVFHRKTASRYISRLTQQVTQLSNR